MIDAGSVLRGALGRQRAATAAFVPLVALHQLAEAGVPVAVGAVIDRAVGTGDGRALLLWLAVVVAVFAVLAAAGFVGYWTAERTQLRASHGIRMDVAARALEPAGGAPGRSGELVSTAGADADRSAEVVEAVMLVAMVVAAVTGGAVVLLQTSVQLGLVVLLGVPLVLLASRLLARPLVGRVDAEQAALATATAVATDVVTGLRVLKGVGAERAAAAAYGRASRAALRARLAAARQEAVHTGATGAVTAVFLALVALLGGRLAVEGRISVGELVAAVGLAQFLLGPLTWLTDIAPMLAGARAAAGRVAAVLGAPPAVRAGTGRLPDAPAGALRLTGPFEVEVAAGTHTGIVCPDPADAALLLDALARDADGPVRVALDGTDLRDVALDEARRAVLVARHEATLFAGTVAENAGDDPAALAAAGADEVVDTLPRGAATELTEQGRSLSGGQRQRLALARALAADPPVLVLHDPTTAVDAATEHRIADGVRALRAGRTTVVVTSSPALLARCDVVLLVSGGAVAARGTHADLVGDARYRAAVLA